MGEIERLEGELKRISNELEQLRRKVEPARSGRTMAFASPVSSQPPQSSRNAPTSEIPATQLQPSSPAPGGKVKTSTRTIQPPAASSGGGNTGRRAPSPALGLDVNESPPPQPSRGKADSGRDLGRYGYVEKSTRSSTGRR
jgi:hypothetical protein